MKVSVTIFLLILCQFAEANLEHRPGQEEKPTPQKLSLSHGCFKELVSLGCTHPKGNRDLFISCLDKKIIEMSSTCQTFFKRLYRK